MEHGLEVKIWGTRGSLAAPYADRMEFGGNTSCVSVQWADQIAVFDCGTGLHALGQEILRAENTHEKSRGDVMAGPGENVWACVSSGTAEGVTKEIHIFFSHLHLDHVCALPFFPVLFRKGWKIHLYGEPMAGESFRDTIRRIVGPPFWPISLDQVAAEIVWHDLGPEETVELPGGATVWTFRANHGPGALLYRMSRSGASVVYGLDHELAEENMEAYCAFVEGCDLLIFDGMYTEEEYAGCRGFGHSAWNWGVKLADRCRIGTVCISHHDWKRTDAVLREMETHAKEENDRCVFAREGMRYQLGQEA